MKASELRIGNFIYDSVVSLLGDNRSVIKVQGIGLVGIQYTFDYKGSGVLSMEYNPDLFSPTPLTEEWLLKFGFENSSHPDFDFHINIPHLRDNNYKSTIGVIEWSDGVIEVYRVNGKTDIHTAETCGVATIQYVHQLQNLYFALTGEELTYGK
jgi:hypothetical protein